jgi:hypothetical protein
MIGKHQFIKEQTDLECTNKSRNTTNHRKIPFSLPPIPRETANLLSQVFYVEFNNELYLWMAQEGYSWI